FCVRSYRVRAIACTTALAQNGPENGRTHTKKCHRRARKILPQPATRQRGTDGFPPWRPSAATPDRPESARRAPRQTRTRKGANSRDAREDSENGTPAARSQSRPKADPGRGEAFRIRLLIDLQRRTAFSIPMNE